MKRIIALAGGVGAARFLDGLARIVNPERLFIVGNTADDAEMHGLHISPDLDTVLYTLAGLANPEHGWGIRGDTFRCLEALGRLGADTWFQLGDCDLATHLFRTEQLRQGRTLAEVTADLATALGLKATLVPMSNQRVRSYIRTQAGELEFQTYFVRRRARDRVLGVRFAGVENAKPAPGVLEAIRNAEAVILCPSNPFISIGPILAVSRACARRFAGDAPASLRSRPLSAGGSERPGGTHDEEHGATRLGCGSGEAVFGFSGSFCPGRTRPQAQRGSGEAGNSACRYQHRHAWHTRTKGIGENCGPGAGY